MMRDLHGWKTRLLQWNIDDIMEAIDSLLSITSAGEGFGHQIR
jgi:hypothetical protein